MHCHIGNTLHLQDDHVGFIATISRVNYHCSEYAHASLLDIAMSDFQFLSCTHLNSDDSGSSSNSHSFHPKQNIDFKKEVLKNHSFLWGGKERA